MDIINPRRACARVTVVVSCVCVSVCLSVTALAASTCVHSGHKRYTRVSRRPFLDFDSWIFEKRYRFRDIAEKSQYAIFLSSPAALSRAVSGPARRRPYFTDYFPVNSYLLLKN